MAETKQYIAVDLGAESGRVILGSVDSTKLTLDEVHRFSNDTIEIDGTLRWDYDRLLADIKTGIGKAAKKADGPIEGIGVDSWGSDHGLIDADGNLMDTPYCYRDGRTDGMMEKAFELMDKDKLYENTGIQHMFFNNLYQFLWTRINKPEMLEKAKHFIFTADLFSYHLCGEVFAEFSLASTSQLVDMRTGKYSKAVFDAMKLPLDIMPDIVETGTVVGKLTDEVAKEIGCENIDVIAVGSHDTASAVAAVPAGQNKWAYLSSGTWSLLGIEIPEPVINEKSYKYQFTNEGGVENTTRCLKNIMGLWLVQECKRQWKKEGADLSYEEITTLATNAKPFAGYIDVEDDSFYAPGEMPKRINEYLAKTGQQTTDDKGQLVRIILESLAMKYRQVLDMLEEMTGEKIDCLHIVGGGIQNQLLCQFAANAIGKEVIAGPIEATASGNILMQARAKGQITSLKQLRQIVSNSFDPKTYQPRDTDLWARQYQKHQK
jgi:sugar (pentulose or hexulose) kinase